MRSAAFTLTLICLLSWATAWAEDPPAEQPEDALLEAVTESPFTLASAMLASYGSDRKPLSAEFVLDTEDRLLLRVRVRVQEQEQRSFEEWLGPVGDAGWVPGRRVLEDEGEIAEASRLQALDPAPNPLREALHAVMRTEEEPDRPADVALSATLASHEGKRAVSLRVASGGRVHGLVFEPATSRFSAAAAGAAPKRVPHEVRTLPALTVPQGEWFNTEEEPSLAAWRGHPILVLVTDPG